MSGHDDVALPNCSRVVSVRAGEVQASKMNVKHMVGVRHGWVDGLGWGSGYCAC